MDERKSSKLQRICWDLAIGSDEKYLIYNIPNNHILNIVYFQVIAPAIPTDFKLATDLTSSPIDLGQMMSYELWDENKLLLPPEKNIDSSLILGKLKGSEITDGGTEVGILPKNAPYVSEVLIEQKITFKEAVYIAFPNFPSETGITFAPIPIRVIMVGELVRAFIEEREDKSDKYVKKL